MDESFARRSGFDIETCVLHKQWLTSWLEYAFVVMATEARPSTVAAIRMMATLAMTTIRAVVLSFPIVRDDKEASEDSKRSPM